VASVVVVLTIALLCAKHRRRAAKNGATVIEHDANTVSTFTLITQMDGPNDETTPPRDADLWDVSSSTVARQRLETELREVHEKMADLQDLSRSSTRVATGSGVRGVLRLMSMPSTATRGLPDVEAQLEASREQINMLMTRMQALEANANSAYGVGFSNEPPPAYV
jgi:BMFP domain-containing protein YqiC